MYIKKVVIDGFKSYAQRTEVDLFDPQFNAITGLNGSGKSNILDSICFVLGIKNLSQVRANNLQDLVYKNGQAGVIKATVSISFDNNNKAQSPVGYENYDEITITRQVVIGGRNKYLINGINAQNNRVEDLFRSVQMNVNNPHFIIMQGRITKVLNMKPPEILSMVEEAAGTKLYESKKQTALKTIEKKDAKLKEIDAVLNEEISPTLEKLREERAAYMEYTKLQREMENLSQLVIAYKYKNAVDTRSQSNKLGEDNENNVKLAERLMKENETRCEQIDVEIKQIEEHKNKDMAKLLKTLEDDYKDKLTLETQAASLLQNKQETLKSEEKKLKDLKTNIESHKKLIKTKNKELEDLKLKTGGIIESGERDQKELLDAQKRLQALAAGLSLDEKGEAATLANQLMAATEEISRRKTEIKQAEIKLGHLRPELQKCKAKVRKSDDQYLQDKLQLEKLEKELAQLEAQIAQIQVEENLEERFLHEKRTTNNEIMHLREKIDDIEARVPQLRFEFRDPERNFDRSRVKGPVAKLISLNDVKTATAIETSAGDRLNYVVIDTEVTGKLLLQHGDLRRRVTFIPLNKISAQTLNNEVIQRAKRLVGDENCDLALSLVDYDGDLESAMRFVFGNTFVCTDMDVAKKVTFSRDIMARSVTLTGELFNPQGTLTGGSSKSSFSLLRIVQQLNDFCRELSEKSHQMENCEKNLHNLRKNLDSKNRLDQQIQAKRREIDSKRGKLEFNDQHQLSIDIKRLETEIVECEQKLKESTELKKKAEIKASEIEERMQNADAYREKETKDAEKKLAQAKKRVESSSKSLQENQQLVDGLKLEIAEIENELTNYESQVTTCSETISQLKSQIEKLAEAARLAKENLQKSEELVNQQKEILRQSSKEIQFKQNEKDELIKDTRKLELKIKKLKQDAEKFQTETRDALKMIDQMKISYPWIADQEKYFGQPGTNFDFSKCNMNDAAKKLQQLQEKTEKMHRTINTRAMNLYTEAEKRCHDLMKKKNIVENDKLKIGDVIKGLDEKKKEALEKAWKQVNKDFGSIFSTLLPNSTAKLEPPAGQTVLDGLEVRVAFGNVWKDSLAELSGGQRSLIALSLILAMLLFKPAPIYILDEVDAALDVSHTQNIGLMLRTHFRHSQFIVVSLKEGMFTNANVLFRTKFIDGRSTVSRQVQTQSRHSHHQQRPLAANQNEESENYQPEGSGQGQSDRRKKLKRKSIENYE